MSYIGGCACDLGAISIYATSVLTAEVCATTAIRAGEIHVAYGGGACRDGERAVIVITATRTRVSVLFIVCVLLKMSINGV